MKKKALFFMLVLMFLSTNALSQNTIYGTVTGDVQEGVTVQVGTVSCGIPIVTTSTETNASGDYSFGGLEEGRYLLLASKSGYSLVPVHNFVDIPQVEIQSYDFTSTNLTCNNVFNGSTSTTWTTLDLSNIVGQNFALVYLKVYSDGLLFDHMWRQNGDSGKYNFGCGGPNVARVDAGGDASCIIVPTDANGIIEWRADRVVNDVHIDVVLFIKQ